MAATSSFEPNINKNCHKNDNTFSVRFRVENKHFLRAVIKNINKCTLCFLEIKINFFQELKLKLENKFNEAESHKKRLQNIKPKITKREMEEKVKSILKFLFKTRKR